MKAEVQSLAGRQAWFTGGMLLAGGLESLIAYGFVGFRGVEGVCFSVLLCLIPGWITIFLAGLMQRSGMAAYTVLVGLGLRMGFVLGGLFAVRFVRSDLGFREFDVWLIAGYLVALALETWVVVVLSQDSDAVV